MRLSTSTFQPLASGTSIRLQHQRLADLISWVNSTALTRAWTLRTSIAVLGLGVATMPIAFLQEGQAAVAITALVGAGLWLVTEIGIAIWADSST